MSVNIVSGVGRVVPPTTASRLPAESTGQQKTPQGTSETEVDQVTRQPVPPRFPWLSWVTARLEPASRQAVPYASVPPLGENVDQRV